MIDKIKLIFAMMLAVAVMQLHASEFEPMFEKKSKKQIELDNSFSNLHWGVLTVFVSNADGIRYNLRYGYTNNDHFKDNPVVKDPKSFREIYRADLQRYNVSNNLLENFTSKDFVLYRNQVNRFANKLFPFSFSENGRLACEVMHEDELIETARQLLDLQHDFAQQVGMESAIVQSREFIKLGVFCNHVVNKLVYTEDD